MSKRKIMTNKQFGDLLIEKVWVKNLSLQTTKIVIAITWNLF